MSFGRNLIFLRKMRKQMSQEELAELLSVSRQTVSKWELDVCYPEINKVMEICKIFSCSMDEICQSDMNINDEAFSNIRMETLEELDYIKYTVISIEPDDDAKAHINALAKRLNISNPDIIGWDFPRVSQEQINVYHMHGYTATLLLPKDFKKPDGIEIVKQHKQKYVAITIKDPFSDPFHLIPSAYKTLMSHIQVNRLSSKEPKEVISCFEREYRVDNNEYMDVFIAISND